MVKAFAFIFEVLFSIVSLNIYCLKEVSFLFLFFLFVLRDLSRTQIFLVKYQEPIIIFLLNTYICFVLVSERQKTFEIKIWKCFLTHTNVFLGEKKKKNLLYAYSKSIFNFYFFSLKFRCVYNKNTNRTISLEQKYMLWSKISYKR